MENKAIISNLSHRIIDNFPRILKLKILNGKFLSRQERNWFNPNEMTCIRNPLGSEYRFTRQMTFCAR